MKIFKSQVAITDFAYERTNGDKEEMVKLTAKLLAENPTLIKEHKRNQLDEQGTKGYIAYAKIKVREYFKRHVAKQAQVTVIPKPTEPAKVNTSRFTVNSDNFAYGTSLKGYITTSYAKLVELFGEPVGSDDYKVSGEWTFHDNKTGNNFTIYDWKSTDLYDDGLPTVEAFRQLPKYKFHVGGNADATEFITILQQFLNQSRLKIVS